MTGTDRNALGKVIWETSHADEQTISVTGANIVADAVNASDWLRAHDAEVIEKAAAVLDGVAAQPWNRWSPAAALIRDYAARIRRGEGE